MSDTASSDAFTLEAFQNPFLAEGADRVDAIVSITATGAVAAGGPAAPLLLGFIIDTSGSMQGARIHAVRSAVEAAVGLLDERASFFVVAFANFGRVVVPPTVATAQAKAAAAAAVRGLEAEGGTAMSQGLAAARSLFSNHPEAIAECVFLTDGKNESEHPQDVAQELSRCTGMFSCDCWGVGTDWQVGEVQQIASTLLGKASLIPEAEGHRGRVPRRDREGAAARRSRTCASASGRRRAATVAFVQAGQPHHRGLHRQGAEVQTPQVREYMTGAWGTGRVARLPRRDRRQARPGGRRDARGAAEHRVLREPRRLGREEARRPRRASSPRWTADDSLSSRLDQHVAHYTGQDELAAAIQQGLELREQGHEAPATQLLGRAVKIAHDERQRRDDPAAREGRRGRRRRPRARCASSAT